MFNNNLYLDSSTHVDTLMRKALADVNSTLATKWDTAVQKCKLSAACKSKI